MTAAKGGIAAALAGLPAGMQGHGLWLGRRQIFVKFAGEAETATLYSADGLAAELRRLVLKSRYHSICLSGRDVLGNVEYVAAAFEQWDLPLPVMVDTDGQRPDAVANLGEKIGLVQVGIDFGSSEAGIDRALQTLEAAVRLSYEHALVLSPREDTSDSQILRVVGRAAAASSRAPIVIHPHVTPESGVTLDRRWSALLEQMQLLHDDVRIMLRLPPPAGMR